MQDGDNGDDGDTGGGQVSETAMGAGEPVEPGDSVAGHPNPVENDRTEEGTQGPDAPPERGRPERDEADRRD